MKANVLIVEDDQAISELVALYLSKDGVTALAVESAEAALDAMRDQAFDLVILDVNLPGMDGFEYLQSLRRVSNVPVIIVSARESDEDKILGLGLGADDFVSKPFSPRELVARVRSQLRRAGYGAGNGLTGSGPGAGAPLHRLAPIEFGPFRLELEERRLTRENAEIALSRKEFELLSYLAARPRISVGAEDLYTAVWGAKFGDLSTVAGHVRRLRMKLEDDASSPRWIVTVHGFGYRFEPEGGSAK